MFKDEGIIVLLCAWFMLLGLQPIICFSSLCVGFVCYIPILHQTMKRTADGKSKAVDGGRDILGQPTKSSGTWTFEDGENLWVYTHEECQPRSKVAAFDMDGTLITTKSGKVFPIDTMDWKLLDEKVAVKLKDLHKNGYKIVIFTNQKGIQVAKVDKAGFKRKIQSVVDRIGCPVQAFISTGGGRYRKPCTGMWDALCNANGSEVIDVVSSFYVGDAAGRHKTKIHPKKDHSCADRYFALNLGIRFETPEHFFLGRKTEDPWGPPDFEPAKLMSSDIEQLSPSGTPLPPATPEVIVMVGFPGSGKSTFARMLEKKHGYFVANRDSLGTWQKCVAKARTELAAGRSVVVDNTNPDVESRSRYTSLAKEVGVGCRCFEVNCSLAQAQHNVRFRGLTRKGVADVGTMVLRMHNSKYKKPELAEGFSAIVTVNFVPSFESKEEEVLYGQYLV